MFQEQAPVALAFASKLRSQGKKVDLSLQPQKPKKFFSRADQNAMRYAAFIGPDDVVAGTVRVKDLDTRQEEQMSI
jgi:histidyl-tRNA synthetase